MNQINSMSESRPKRQQNQSTERERVAIGVNQRSQGHLGSIERKSVCLSLTEPRPRNHESNHPIIILFILNILFKSGTLYKMTDQRSKNTIKKKS